MHCSGLRHPRIPYFCRHPLLLVEWLKGQAGMRRSAAKSTGTKTVSMRQLANRKENMNDSDSETDGQNVGHPLNMLPHDMKIV